MNNKVRAMEMRFFLMIFVFGFTGIVVGQEEKEDRERIIAEAKQHVSEGNKVLIQDGNFPKAEGEYRKAINTNVEDVSARYNLANSYYNSEKYDEANLRYKETTKIATNKEEKHKAFHNQGNTFMEQKKYKEAVEAYKNALRNNPKDEETRYNLALAKKMLEEEQKKNDQNKDKDKDKDKEKDNDNKDQKDKDKDQKDKGDQDNKDQEGDDKKEDKKDEGDKEKDQKDKEGDDKKDGKPDDKKGEQKGDPKEQKQQPQQVQGQLSPQQVKSLLEAMSNEEKKVQQKINAKKAKGAKTKSEKDW